MKLRLGLHNTLNKIKVVTIISAGILNIIGINSMLKGISGWDDYILYSIYVLGGTLLLSGTMGVLKDKAIKKSLQFFLEKNNLKDAEIVRKTDTMYLLKKDEQHFTVSLILTKEGIGFILTPATVEWKGDFLFNNGESKEVTLSYMPGWENPDWKTSIKDTLPPDENVTSVDVKEDDKKDTE